MQSRILEPIYFLESIQPVTLESVTFASHYIDIELVEIEAGEFGLTQWKRG